MPSRRAGEAGILSAARGRTMLRVTRPDRAPRLVLTTAPDRRAAARLARAFVGRRAAACVNVLPGVRSVYRWQGRVEQADELLLVIKTTAGRVREIERLLADLHPYDVPECVVLAPDHVERKYLAWLCAEASPAGGRPRASRAGGRKG